MGGELSKDVGCDQSKDGDAQEGWTRVPSALDMQITLWISSQSLPAPESWMENGDGRNFQPCSGVVGSRMLKQMDSLELP